MGIVGLVAIFAGFSKPFIIPVVQQTFEAPHSIYIHGALSLAWVLLFTIQSSLIHKKNYKLHTQFGFAGIFLAIATSLSLLPVAKFIVERDLKSGLGEMAYSNSVSLFTTGIMFLGLVGFAIYNRRQSTIHKRLLLLATIVLLWPAWFRFRHFFPNVPEPEIWFGLVLSDSLIIIAWIWDKTSNKRIHPSLLYPGIAIIAEQTIEVLLYDSNIGRAIGKLLYEMI
ncbi:hypothetical protein DSECCO2_407610 [anaerobic digester metagenome]